MSQLPRSLLLLLSTAAVCSVSAQSPRTHRLEATPDTVSYGYYWFEAKPVLRIASGDILDVDTLITNGVHVRMPTSTFK
jgi:hypothetical protein